MGSNVTAAFRAHKKGAGFANPCYTQIHPTCIPVSSEHQSKLTLMSESLRNDGRVWVPKKKGDDRPPSDIPEGERDYYLERRYPSFGNLVPRDVASRAAKERCDEGFGVGESGLAVYLDFADAIERLGEDTIRARYGNLFQMYEKIAAENPYKTPMRIFPAVHYTMGGLWVDYNLQTTVPGLFALGECNFSDHGANRLGASALMQGLADGYFVAPYTVSNYLGEHGEMDAAKKVTTAHPAFDEAEAAVIARTERLLAVNGTQSIDSFHKRLGLIMWDNCGMGRTKETLTKALEEIPKLREEFWSDVRIPGGDKEFNAEVEKANRVADFLEFAETMCLDALTREESCGGHFREEHQSGEGEAQRDDENYAHAAVWEYTGEGNRPELSIEQLEFENVMLTTRSYK